MSHLNGDRLIDRLIKSSIEINLSMFSESRHLWGRRWSAGDHQGERFNVYCNVPDVPTSRLEATFSTLVRLGTSFATRAEAKWHHVVTRIRQVGVYAVK